MLIDFRTLFPKYGIKPRGIIQVGAHWADEHDVYMQMGIPKIIYIEPCKEAYEVMVKRFLGEGKFHYSFIDKGTGIDCEVGTGILIFNAACGDIESEMIMHVSHDNQGQSNSLLKPLLHLEQHPSVVFTDTETVKVLPLDKMPFPKSRYTDLEGEGNFYNQDDYNILIMDTQGFEGQVLKGAIETLKRIDFIYTECNRGQTYAGNMEIEEMDFLLEKQGFKRVETYWPSPNLTWGDCAYIRSELLPKQVK